jgi:glycosyltransferase involved in cell wall biosynthesis
MAKKTLLYISPGPTFWPRSQAYQDQFIELSRTFKGYIFTTSSRTETFPIGDFLYFSMKSGFTKIDRLRFFALCLWNATNLLIQKEKIDLVATYDPFYTGLIGLISSCMARAKFAPEVRGVFTSAAQWIDGPDSLEKKLRRVIYPAIMPVIMRFVLKHADGIRLLFENQIDMFRDVTKGKVIRAFPPLVPTDRFKNVREDKEILFVGFPFKLKGADILIKAFKKISSKYQDWKLKILGWYPDPKELNDEIDGHPQIYHHKPVPYKEMPDHIGSCGIFVLPSRSEAMGRVLVEAMAAGKPRIGSNVEGIPSVINDGVDGLLFETENADDLAEKLDMLMSDQQLRQKLGKAAEIRAKQEFTRSNYFSNLITFYNEVLEK